METCNSSLNECHLSYTVLDDDDVVFVKLPPCIRFTLALLRRGVSIHSLSSSHVSYEHTRAGKTATMPDDDDDDESSSYCFSASGK